MHTDWTPHSYDNGTTVWDTPIGNTIVFYAKLPDATGYAGIISTTTSHVRAKNTVSKDAAEILAHRLADRVLATGLIPTEPATSGLVTGLAAARAAEGDALFLGNVHIGMHGEAAAVALHGMLIQEREMAVQYSDSDMADQLLSLVVSEQD